MSARPIFLTALLILPFSLSVLASDSIANDKSCSSGLNHYVSGNYLEAFSILKKQADSGLDCAQHWVARMYQMGYGTPMNREKSLAYYQLAADKGFPQAILQLEILK
ncbi:hypothetical protein EOPP23_17735 [Endozoicomonas sp. OPT23]|uniref:tetratricopeptide repeat protein n=1 Tax=Endozoicomonas sp. OPT23 TaxID=2072845 RepID=UPI00129A3296|nr:sel1 repeat family protein [Endozoicomonas sp. OPT23]MRI34822.1 hypothetical protein [Endozoicomonas sp. OPT23]